ncbi:DRTGG domain-containing protein [Paenibacillus thalictri]|nr:DRTGG domain-containing protein [Paenibacillus thalictri]
MTKHEQIIQYIEALEIGTRISVRKLSQSLEVSEGTAYRAIKEAENKGMVSTKERLGTVRVENKQRQGIDKLTFEEIVRIVDGKVLGGAGGLEQTLNKFVIGAMQLEAMIRYIEPGDLLIVGNREKVHHSALEVGAGVLVTGGFDTAEEVKVLADELKQPIISTSYDTFTVATLINRAIYDRLIKKQIILVGDIAQKEVVALHESDTVEQLKRKIENTNHTRFPVVDDANRPIGMITTKDLVGAAPNERVDKLMTSDVMTVTAQTTIATAGHMMVWEGIELLPVINKERELQGVISRKDVLKAMQNIKMQPQNGETLEDQIWSGFEALRDEQGRLYFSGVITPQMSNHFGNLSEGLLADLVSQVVYRTVKELRKGDLLIDSSSAYYFSPIEMDSIVTLVPNVIEATRRFCKIEVEVFSGGTCVAKSMYTARFFNQM